jgi:uncharacterized protein YcbX
MRIRITMSVVGRVDSLWRYPVKSMRGEELDQAYAGFAGIYGDRLFAFYSADHPRKFPWLTAREQREMLRYRPRFRHPEAAILPLNFADANEAGLTPVYAEMADLIVDVEAPSGEVLAIDDPRLSPLLCDTHPLDLARSHRAMTDCHPVSLISVQTARQLEEELGTQVDLRRFRANVYLDLLSAGGFGEDQWVGRSLRIGSKVVVSILKRDTRCAMITLDPDTGASNPLFLKKVAQAHEGMAGVYGAVLVEGLLQKGDPVELLD